MACGFTVWVCFRFDVGDLVLWLRLWVCTMFCRFAFSLVSVLIALLGGWILCTGWFWCGGARVCWGLWVCLVWFCMCIGVYGCVALFVCCWGVCV